MKGTKKKRLISVLLTATMLLGATASMPLSASAVTTERVESNTEYGNEYGCLTYERTDDGVGYKITGCFGEVTEIEIPDYIDNIPVVEIDTYAFACCENLTSVVIPATVIRIGDSAFTCCNDLTNVIISNGVVAIGGECI